MARNTWASGGGGGNASQPLSAAIAWSVEAPGGFAAPLRPAGEARPAVHGPGPRWQLRHAWCGQGHCLTSLLVGAVVVRQGVPCPGAPRHQGHKHYHHRHTPAPHQPEHKRLVFLLGLFWPCLPRQARRSLLPTTGAPPPLAVTQGKPHSKEDPWGGHPRGGGQAPPHLPQQGVWGPASSSPHHPDAACRPPAHAPQAEAAREAEPLGGPRDQLANASSLVFLWLVIRRDLGYFAPCGSVVLFVPHPLTQGEGGARVGLWGGRGEERADEGEILEGKRGEVAVEVTLPSLCLQPLHGASRLQEASPLPCVLQGRLVLLSTGPGLAGSFVTPGAGKGTASLPFSWGRWWCARVCRAQEHLVTRVTNTTTTATHTAHTNQNTNVLCSCSAFWTCLPRQARRSLLPTTRGTTSP
ncbi:hypothetical protein GWK47_044620 [Chionoecetes opilio]|uniref:Uncharacterized protein n=1 Tax=Chionoecetes opilio TaxID=41210 RepID=A0A8J4Y722_CHIOP|nr:hypothetical protein GWK47_044620 [Chionoecetes opilio]